MSRNNHSVDLVDSVLVTAANGNEVAHEIDLDSPQFNSIVNSECNKKRTIVLTQIKIRMSEESENRTISSFMESTD